LSNGSTFNGGPTYDFGTFHLDSFQGSSLDALQIVRPLDALGGGEKGFHVHVLAKETNPFLRHRKRWLGEFVKLG
jgi:hypothetical protein